MSFRRLLQFKARGLICNSNSYEDRDRRPVETYRPSERGGRDAAPPRDTYRARSPPRRDREPPAVDSYFPRDGRGDSYNRGRIDRRRSRSPVMRGRDDRSGYRGRPRSPLRGHSPRRNIRERSPLVTRRYSRSPQGGPPRARSPLPPKRGRDMPPVDVYRQRSPPAKRERYAEPAYNGHAKRGYSPPRGMPTRGPPPREVYREEKIYRPRERSRSPLRVSAQVSRGQSPISSRRSSPPVHPDRVVMSRSPTYGGSHAEEPAEFRSREQSPPVREYTPRQRSPLEPITYRDRSPPPREREPVREKDPYRPGTTPNTWSNSQMAPSGSNYRNGDTRLPPSGPGPSRYENHTRDIPPGPPSAPISMSAHNRPTSASLLSAPTKPRAGSGFARDGPRDGPYGTPPYSHRGGRYHNGPPPLRHQSSYDYNPPTGPRQTGPNSAPPYDAPPPRPFRSNNSSSTTYPRTQRFSQHLSTVPTVVPGGRRTSSGLEPGQEKRLQQLEDDRKKLLEQIEEKQRSKRQALREWEKSERDSAREGLRSELAEGHLDRLSGGEGGMSSGAY